MDVPMILMVALFSIVITLIGVKLILELAMLRIIFSMPVMRWVTFEEVVALKCGGHMVTGAALVCLCKMRVLEAEMKEEHQKRLVEQILAAVAPMQISFTVMITSEVTLATLEQFRYRLVYRPPRKPKKKPVEEGPIIERDLVPA